MDPQFPECNVHGRIHLSAVEVTLLDQAGPVGQRSGGKGSDAASQLETRNIALYRVLYGFSQGLNVADGTAGQQHHEPTGHSTDTAAPVCADFAGEQARLSIKSRIAIGDGIAGETRNPACAVVEEPQCAERGCGSHVEPVPRAGWHTNQITLLA